MQNIFKMCKNHSRNAKYIQDEQKIIQELQNIFKKYKIYSRSAKYIQDILQSTKIQKIYVQDSRDSCKTHVTLEYFFARHVSENNEPRFTWSAIRCRDERYTLTCRLERYRFVR